MSYSGAWRNVGFFSSDMYVQICKPEELQNCNPKLWQLIDKYGSAFDEDWWYFLTKTERYVRRVPLWMSNNPSGKIPCEKPRRFEPNQKLVEFMCVSPKELQENK